MPGLRLSIITPGVSGVLSGTTIDLSPTELSIMYRTKLTWSCTTQLKLKEVAVMLLIESIGGDGSVKKLF